jgi:hypothetical protein
MKEKILLLISIGEPIDRTLIKNSVEIPTSITDGYSLAQQFYL